MFGYDPAERNRRLAEKARMRNEAKHQEALEMAAKNASKNIKVDYRLCRDKIKEWALQGSTSTTYQVSVSGELDRKAHNFHDAKTAFVTLRASLLKELLETDGYSVEEHPWPLSPYVDLYITW